MWGFVALFAIFGLFVLYPAYGEICEQRDNAQHKECSSYHVVFVAGWHVAKFFDSSSATINALATVVIAAFTITLWLANRRMWKTSERQIAASEEASRHQLRAYLHVEKVDVVGKFNDELPPMFKIRFKNYGLTPAHRVANKCSTVVVFEGEPPRPRPEVFRYAVLGPSQGRTTLYSAGDIGWKMLRFSKMGTLYLIGEITYLDAFQVGRPEAKLHSTTYRYLVHEGSEGSIMLSMADVGNDSD